MGFSPHWRRCGMEQPHPQTQIHTRQAVTAIIINISYVFCALDGYAEMFCVRFG